MNLQSALIKRNISMYHLSKISGVPKTTVIDICAGRSSLEKCSAKTVLLIAKALNCSMEELLEPDYDINGKPVDNSYLECGLPAFLMDSLSNFKAAIEKQQSGVIVSLIDCYYCELQSDINSAEINNMISSEQAWYLRGKYLGLER
ncbi:MAG: helix-turn-helix transcriptional regulator [Clostridia bacterium]|nr:helix-turn-helix transcriptional regulator [Clostridia bacterium]